MSRASRRMALAGAGAALWTFACGDSGQAPSAPTPKPPPAQAPAPAPKPAPAPPAAKPTPPAAGGASQAVARGDALYQQWCASCHGARGEGDGPVSATLDPKPARHSDGRYMNALSDEHLFKVIEQGGPAVGKSPLMTAWGGVLSDAQIRDVIAYVRSLADPPYSAGG